MVHHYPTMTDYQRALIARESRALLLGFNVSPGFIAASLGQTRASIYKAIKEGRIDAVKIGDLEDHKPVVLLNFDQIMKRLPKVTELA